MIFRNSLLNLPDFFTRIKVAVVTGCGVVVQFTGNRVFLDRATRHHNQPQENIEAQIIH
jgi:hypothetical protein